MTPRPSKKAQRLGFKTEEEYIVFSALKKNDLDVQHNVSMLGTEIDLFISPNIIIEVGFRDEYLMEKWDDFRCCMAQLLRHIDFCVLRLRKPVDPFFDHYLSWFPHVLMKVYGPNGEKAAFEIARTGNEGGLYSVIKAVAMHVADKYSQNEISAKVGAYLDSLSVDEQLDACSEYISKYGHILPSEITEANAIRIRANFRKVLEKHPRLLLKFHSVGR